MSAAAPPPVIPPATAEGIDPNDPLGYDAYAKTLWARIDHALNRDATTGKLGDDPLVIGLFGEWGVGKTYLLDKIRDHATRYSTERAELRRNDGGFDLTIPVYFQPWKYEHEEHLHVPLLLHTLKALEEGVKQSQTFWERVGQGAQKPGDAIVKALPKIVTLFKKAVTSAAVVIEPASGAAFALTQSVADDTAKTSARPKKPSVASALKYTDDGRYYFEIHKVLKAVTRPAQHEGYLDKLVINNTNFKINFVVFVDDLDRCLPEKAVQVLELIKTVFNVESFAFVLALDDEVIERGIGHRYKDYTFENKKPQMPITGFEYLEKIVHLPFRLPALTRAQAVAFARTIEERVEPKNAPRHWFAPTSPESAGMRLSKGVQQNPRAESDAVSAAGNRSEPEWFAPAQSESAHLDLLLASFDAYVPRKLLRAVELWHQVCRVARERGVSGAEGSSTTWVREYAGKPVRLDTRVVFALMLLQLFQPELFRFMRRRERAFQVLLNAFSEENLGGIGKYEISDVELWSWASYRKGEPIAAPDVAPTADPAPVPVVLPAFKRPCSEAEAVALIASLASVDAYLAQHIRLRLVERLVEHFAVQRHVFNPLRVMAWLGEHLDAGMVNTFVGIDAYFAVLSQHTEQDLLDVQEQLRAADKAKAAAEKAKAAADIQAGAVGTPTVIQKLPTFSFAKVDALFDVLVAIDTAARSDLDKQFDLPEGRVLDDAIAASLRAKFLIHTQKIAQPGRSATWQGFDHAIGAVAAIAPWLGWAQGGKQVVATVAGAQESDTTSAVIKKLLGKAPTPKSCAAIGDLLERFPEGDPRFDRARFQLPSERFHQKTENEPMIGFVRIPGSKKPFQMGHLKESDNPPTPVVIKDTFYMARTLTTVDQYAQFAKDGYSAGIEIWGKQGLEWREGSRDSKVTDEGYRRWLKQRPAALRKEPWEWIDQRAHGSRPVTGVTWFEARAYARWLDLELQHEIGDVAALNGYQVALPTEDQWERAARAQSLTVARNLRWPWGDDEKNATKSANIHGSDVGEVSSVGVFPPNSIGLYDMAGNAWEWMDNIYADPSGDRFPRVLRDQDLVTDRLSLRGGSWINPPENASCSSRTMAHPFNWGHFIGFRVVLSLAKNEN